MVSWDRMKLCRGTAHLLLPALALLLCGAPALAQDQPALIATPASGQPGQKFYLAGGGFPANQPLTVFMFCPDFYENLYGNRWHWTVQTDGQGNFVAWPLYVPTPNFVKETSCWIRAHNGDNPFGVGVKFRIVSTDVKPVPRTFSIRVRVAVAHVTSGLSERVDLRGAPGALLTLSWSYPGSKAVLYRIRLPWTGRLVRKWNVSYRVDRGQRVALDVRGRLGDLVGRTRTQIVVQR